MIALATLLIMISFRDLYLYFPVLILLQFLLVNQWRFNDRGFLFGGLLAEIQHIVVFAVRIAGVFWRCKCVIVVAIAMVSFVRSHTAICWG